MATRKSTKFNKNTGYKDFSFSKTKTNTDFYNKSPELTTESKIVPSEK